VIHQELRKIEEFWGLQPKKVNSAIKNIKKRRRKEKEQKEGLTSSFTSEGLFKTPSQVLPIE
jgi:ribosomal protein L23